MKKAPVISAPSSLFALTAGAGNLNLGNLMGLGLSIGVKRDWPELDRPLSHWACRGRHGRGGFVHAARISKRIKMGNLRIYLPHSVSKD